MSWDPVLLRKYNTTGHFRLLNQLRNELKSYPIRRPQNGPVDGSKGAPGPSARAVDIRPQPQGYGRSRRSGGYGAQSSSTGQGVPAAESLGGSSASSFRDRLNAIDMR